jgi:hypothetical protein
MPDWYPCNGRYIFPIRLTQRLWASGSPLFNGGYCRMRSSSADSINSNAAQCSPTLTNRPPLRSSQKSPRIKRPRATRHIKPIRTFSYSQNTPLKRSLSIHRKHKKGKGKGPTSVLHSDWLQRVEVWKVSDAFWIFSSMLLLRAFGLFHRIWHWVKSFTGFVYGLCDTESTRSLTWELGSTMLDGLLGRGFASKWFSLYLYACIWILCFNFVR